MDHKKTRIVVRNLPHNLEENDFLPLIKPYMDSIQSWYYVKGKNRLANLMNHDSINSDSVLFDE